MTSTILASPQQTSRQFLRQRCKICPIQPFARKQTNPALCSDYFGIFEANRTLDDEFVFTEAKLHGVQRSSEEHVEQQR